LPIKQKLDKKNQKISCHFPFEGLATMVTVVTQISSSDVIYLDILYNFWAYHHQNRPTHSFKNNLQKTHLPPTGNFLSGPL